ncbi:MAG TPA: spermidine synthase [Acidimicrobiia bacterium]|nr:spermidine synthase [Acidimicrobiia bacterium]
MSDRLRLVLLSFLMLFVELALIRWAGSNVLYLSYFSNFVLLGSFLGIGIGFLRARSARDLFPYFPLALAALVAFVRFFPVTIRSSGADLLFFGIVQRSGPPRYVVLAVVFVAVTAAMAFLGEGVARAFAKFPPLDAYRLDLIGSVAGIVGFTALSFLHAPPLAWGIVVAVALAALYIPRINIVQIAGLLAVLAILGAESFAGGTSWSPYYKIEVKQDANLHAPIVSVNGVPHQAILPTSAHAPIIYTRVYDRVANTSLDDVLIVGAGTGNDVAFALSRGAKRIDAVEIDPRLHQLGKELHPDKPFANPRVHSHIDDGRAFLQRTHRHYDLILFALPDSITLVAGQSSLRLESYLFTKEAIETARDHLKPNGAFGMYNYYEQRWLIDRYAGTLNEVFGRPPCLDDQGGTGFHLAFLEDAKTAGALRCDATWVTQTTPVPRPATDDHPFPYLRTRTIPGFYLATIALILLAAVAMVRVAAGPFRPMTRYADLFFMGAAFLLLETMYVVRFALFFGTTWVVNALVFGGVLLSVLLAVEVSKRVTFRRPVGLYAILVGFLALAFVVPPSSVLSLALPLRFLVAVGLAFAPIFMANLVFTQRFKDAGSSTVAFGANLLGAMFGGLLEYGALIVGYRALLIVVGVLYGCAFAFGRRHFRANALATSG